ncbi:hypothetical protein FOBRF1_012101 [Fusarium oxysporum]
MFQCNPVKKQRDLRTETGTCISPGEIVSAAYALSAMTIISDWLYGLLPVPMLWGVKMTIQAKMTVIVILGLGIFIATIVRLFYIHELFNGADILYEGTDSMLWSIIEPGVAIVASSLATIRPLLRFFRIKGFTSENSYGTGFSSSRHTAGRSKARGRSTYGPQDVSLAVIDPNRSEQKQPRPISLETKGAQTIHDTFPDTSRSESPQSENRGSEVYGFQGQQTGSEASPHGSVDQILDLEQQDQSSGSHGRGY